MSRRTRSVAVAVSAMIGTSGNSARSLASWRYSGRKSWPHSLMQCASSIAICAMFQPWTFSMNDSSISRSGAT